MKWDVVSLVEAAYDLESGDRVWLARLLRQAAPRLDTGLGIAAATHAPGRPIDELRVETLGMSVQLEDALINMTRAYPQAFGFSNGVRGSGRCVTATQQLGLSRRTAKKFGPFVELMRAARVRDFVSVLSLDPSGHVVWLGAARADIRHLGRHERATWNRVTAHISAGARLRRTLARPMSPDPTRDGDAVLSGSGALEHAEPRAKTFAARELLRHAARAIDRARGKVRSNESRGLGALAWPRRRSLVAGRTIRPRWATIPGRLRE